MEAGESSGGRGRPRKGRCPVEHVGISVLPSVRPSVRPSVHPPREALVFFSIFGLPACIARWVFYERVCRFAHLSVRKCISIALAYRSTTLPSSATDFFINLRYSAPDGPNRLKFFFIAAN